MISTFNLDDKIDKYAYVKTSLEDLITDYLITSFDLLTDDQKHRFKVNLRTEHFRISDFVPRWYSLSSSSFKECLYFSLNVLCRKLGVFVWEEYSKKPHNLFPYLKMIENLTSQLLPEQEVKRQNKYREASFLVGYLKYCLNNYPAELFHRKYYEHSLLPVAEKLVPYIQENKAYKVTFICHSTENNALGVFPYSKKKHDLIQQEIVEICKTYKELTDCFYKSRSFKSKYFDQPDFKNEYKTFVEDRNSVLGSMYMYTVEIDLTLYPSLFYKDITFAREIYEKDQVGTV